MAESTLSAQYTDLEGDVGFFLGFGRGVAFSEAAWSVPQQTSIDRCIKGGMRNLYHCGYAWSFLKPMASLTLAINTKTVALPADYAGYEGEVILAPSGSVSQGWFPMRVTGIGRVYQKEAELPATTGRPQLVCEEPLKGTTATTGQRFQLRFWPLADQAYTIELQYYLLPDFFDGTHPFAYGGAAHAETLLESCLAVAEKLLDDAATVHAAEFEKRLAVSKDIDRRTKPSNLGPNIDRSDLREGYRRGPWRSWTPVQVNGITY